MSDSQNLAEHLAVLRRCDECRGILLQGRPMASTYDAIHGERATCPGCGGETRVVRVAMVRADSPGLVLADALAKDSENRTHGLNNRPRPSVSLSRRK